MVIASGACGRPAVPPLGADSDVRNGFNDIKVTFNIDADASRQDIESLVAQSVKRSAVFDALTNPTDVTVEVA